MFTLFNVVFVVVTMLLDILLFGATPDNPTSPRYLTTLYGLFVFLPTLTVVVRRSARYRSQRLVAGRLLRRGVRLYDPDDDRQRADAGRKGQRNGVDGGRIRSADDHCRLDDRLDVFRFAGGREQVRPQSQADRRSGRIRGACRRCRAVGAGDSESGVTGFRRRICVVPARNDALFFYFCEDECE